MSKIIRFPHALQSNNGSNVKPMVTSMNTTNNFIHLGPWEFTCPSCDAKTSFQSENMIFRTVEFYCSSCGALHKVTNPAFINMSGGKK